MKVSEQWLRAWVNPDSSFTEIADKLTMAGLEVAEIAPAAAKFEHILVGQITSISPHPKQDKLCITEIAIKEGKSLTIVTGAKNINVNDKVPVAIVGAKLPGSDKAVTEREFAGVMSQGVMCSEEELGLGDDNSGILILDENAPVGHDCFDYYHLDDEIIELELTPNRGDCLSMAGVAREVGVVTQTEVSPMPIEPIANEVDDVLPITIKAKAGCPRYVGRVIRDVDSNKQSPLWLQERLRRAGIRSISAAVDVTNYVMLELGQPMHAFDLGTIEEGIVVRYANEGEEIVLLDGKTLKLAADDLLIADANKPRALAGIMGGEDSGVSDTTSNLFLESAHFDQVNISGKARRYGLATDSSHRFERGVDPSLTDKAIERATELLLSICGGKPGPVVAVGDKEIEKPAVTLTRERLDACLGMHVPDNFVTDILMRLGLEPISSKDSWTVTVPSYRFDIAIEEDLIEEVGRLYGYDNIKAKDNKVHLKPPVNTESYTTDSRLSRLMTDLGYQEFITYSFVNPTVQSLLFPESDSLPLLNPISQDLSVMRVSLWPGLLTGLQYNQNRQIERLRAFETGLCFRVNNGNLEQEMMIGGLIAGPNLPEQWGEKAKPIDFYDLKGDVETLLGFSGNPDAFSFKAATHSSCHPGQTAEIIYQDKSVGVLGQLHPNLVNALDLKGPVFLFECELKALKEARLPEAKTISKYPAIRRDLAFIVAEEIDWHSMRVIVTQTAGDLLHELHLFDVYQGKGIENGKKSIALGLTLQHQSRTLIDSEVNQVVDNVVAALRDQVSATMRE